MFWRFTIATASMVVCVGVLEAALTVGLSWRVHILPYLESQEFYEKFNLDEPWDSEHNKALIPLMPDIYQSNVVDLPEGKTLLLRPVGNGAFAATKDLEIGQQVSFSDITDDHSRTILVVEVAPSECVIWTKPADYRFDPNNPTRGLGGVFRKLVNVGFVDGSANSLVIERGDSESIHKSHFTIASADDFEE